MKIGIIVVALSLAGAPAGAASHRRRTYQRPKTDILPSAPHAEPAIASTGVLRGRLFEPWRHDAMRRGASTGYATVTAIECHPVAPSGKGVTRSSGWVSPSAFVARTVSW